MRPDEDKGRESKITVIANGNMESEGKLKSLSIQFVVRVVGNPNNILVT